MSRRLVVDAALAGLRLDAFLVRAGIVTTAGQARRLIGADLVRVEGRGGKKGQTVAAGQGVDVVDEAVVVEAAPSKDGVALEILYQDDDLVAVDKPAGLPSHPLRAGETGTAANALVARFPECARASDDPREAGLGHRLDRDTSGVLLAARHPEAWRRLRQVLGGAGGQKTYLAEIVGRPGVAVIDAAIGRTGRRGAKVKIDAGRGPLPARTEIAVREFRARTTLIEARIDRGRTHQIRAHLASIGCPILGDRIYGDEGSLALADDWGVRATRLHAASVVLVHPMTGKPLTIEAPAPPWARPGWTTSSKTGDVPDVEPSPGD